MKVYSYNANKLEILKNAIELLNKDLLNEELRSSMFRIASNTKGYHYKVNFKKYSYAIESYELCTDYEALVNFTKNNGYWSQKVQDFNFELRLKGGDGYKNKLNNTYLSSLK